MSRGFRRLLIVLGALGVLVAAAWLVMSTPWFRRTLERRVVRAAEDLTGTRIEVREFRFNPVILQLTMRGLVMRGTEPASAPPLFSARNVVVGLSPSALLRRRVVLRSLEWDAAEIHVQTGPGGETNLPGPKLSTHGSQALHELLNLNIGRLTVLHTNLYWNDRKVPVDLSARDIAFQVRRHLLRGYEGSFSSAQTALESSPWSLPASTVAAQFRFTRTELIVDSLIFRSQGVNGKCSAKLDTLPSLHARINFSVAGDIPELARLSRRAPGVTGKLKADGVADYSQGQWTSQGHIDVSQLMIPAAELHPGRLDVSADYSFQQQRAAIANLRISLLGGSVEGAGEALFSGASPAFDFHAQVRNIDMGAAFHTLPGLHTLSTHLPPESSINGKVRAAWRGNFLDFESKFDLEFTARHNMLPPSVPVDGFARGTARISRGIEIDFEDSRLQTPHSYVTARGSTGESGSNLSVRLGTADFDELRPLAQFLLQPAQPVPLLLKSQATFDGQVLGPIADADIRGQLHAGPFQYRGSSWDGFTANIRATRTFFEVSQAHLFSHASDVLIDASSHLVNWQLDRHEPTHFALSAQHMPVGLLQPVFSASYPITGLLSGRLNLDGPISRLAGSGEVQIDSGAIYNEPFDALSTKVRVSESNFVFDNLQLSRGAARVSGHAEFNPGSGAVSASLHGRNLAFTDFKRVLHASEAGIKLDEISGVVSVDLDAHVAPGAQAVDFHSTWQSPNVAILGTPVGELSGKVDAQGERIKMQVASQGPGGSFHLEGEAQTQGDWPAELSGDYSNFRADPWIRLFAGSKFTAGVTAAGTLSVNGPLRDVNRLDVESQTRSLEINLGDQSWSNAEPISLLYAQQTITAKAFHMRGPSTDLEVDGSLRVGSPPELSLRAHGESEARLLSLIDPALRATGRSELSLTISGAPSQPLLRGTISVQGVSLGYGDFPFRLSGLSGDVQLEGDRATAQSLRGQIGSGSATLSGSVTFAGVTRFNLRAALEQVRVQYPSNFTSVLTGDLNLSGTAAGGQLSGDLVVRQMIASESFNVLNLIGEASGAGGTAPASLTPSPLAPKIRLNIRVSSDPEVRLETHDLRLVADVDMAVRGTLAIPVEMGTVHILSGEAVVRGNRYRINRGDISMANPFRTSPVLDLEARTRVQRYDVTADISGPFDQMKVAYRSDPPLPSGDILSLLALGFVRETGQTAIATTESARTVGASALLSQALSSQTTGRIQRLFGVSRIRIDPNVGGPANVSGARVTVEQQVTHDLTLTYATNTGATQQQVVQFEWALSERLSLIGIRDQNGIFGVEFRLRRGFK